MREYVEAKVTATIVVDATNVQIFTNCPSVEEGEVHITIVAGGATEDDARDHIMRAVRAIHEQTGTE